MFPIFKSAHLMPGPKNRPSYKIWVIKTENGDTIFIPDKGWDGTIMNGPEQIRKKRRRVANEG